MLLIYFVLSLFCRGNTLGPNEMQMVLSHIHELQQASLFWTLEYYLCYLHFTGFILIFISDSLILLLKQFWRKILMFHQLPKKYYRLLNHLYMCHKKGVTFIYSNKHPIFKNDAHTMDLCDWLRDNDYIKYVNSYNQKRNELYSDTHLIITPSGITYVENHKFQLIQWWTSLVLSIVACISSILTLIFTCFWKPI